MMRAGSESSALETLRARGWSDIAERDRLVRLVVGGPGGEDLSVLTSLLLVDDEEVQRAGLIRLKRLGSPNAVDTLLRQVAGVPTSLAQSACEKLALIAAPGSAQRASWFLTSGLREVRLASESFILGGALDRDVLGVVLSWLDPEVHEERVLRVLALLGRDLGPSELARAEIDEALRRLVRHTSTRVRREAYRLLARGGRKETLRFFVECSGDETEELRTQLEEEIRAALPGFGAEAGDALVGMLISARPAERQLAAELLGSLPAPAEAVCRFFATGRELPSWARRRAALALGGLQAELVRPLGRLIESGPGLESEYAIQAACELGLVEPLERSLASSLRWGAWPQRWQVADALGHRGSGASVEALSALLGDEHTADVALVALARIAGRLVRAGDVPRALEALEEHHGLLLHGRSPAPDAGAPGRVARRMTVVEELAWVEQEEVFRWLSGSTEHDVDRGVRRAAGRVAIGVGRALELETSSVELALQRIGRAWPEESADPLTRLFMEVRQVGATELKLSPSREPLLRLEGRWERLSERGRWTASELEGWLRGMLDDHRAAELAERGAVSFMCEVDGLGLFRGSLFVDARGVNAVFRAVAEEPLSVAEVGLGGLSTELLTLGHGLGLVVAPQGQGKTTTVAALAHALATERHALAVVLCSSDEFQFAPRRGAVVVRQQGEDFDDIEAAIHESLLLGAEVLVLDGLDSPKARTAAVKAARRGVLVLATSSGTRRAQGIGPWRSVLEEGLVPLNFVASQRLVPRDDRPGLAAVSEVSLRVHERGRPSALVVVETFESALHELVENGVLTLETARRQGGTWLRDHARARRGGDDDVVG